MSKEIYWGGEEPFGPFNTQEDGWPNAGEVMRHFREKLGITAKAFGKLYGKEIRSDGKPICERWILEMELENKVPCDIARRRIIARLLHIPPELLGLAVLSDIALQPSKEHTTLEVSSGKNSSNHIDISLSKRNINVALHLHLTSNAQNLLNDIERNREHLSFVSKQMKGGLLHQAKELLIANDLLAAKILRDQMCYAVAYAYADHALSTAESIEDDELAATAYYTRGCIKLQWGQFGYNKQGRFQIERTKILDAKHDFQVALNKETSHGVTLHPQLQGFIMLQIGRALSLLQMDNNTQQVLRLVDQAASTVECNSIDDLYTRVIVTGTLSGLHQGGYYLTRTDIFTLAGLPDEAMRELTYLNRLTERTYSKEETRNQAWHKIVQAKALLGLREYTEAARSVREALIACYGIRSRQNIAVAADIYSQLASSPYKTSGDVKELGEILQEWYEF